MALGQTADKSQIDRDNPYDIKLHFLECQINLCHNICWSRVSLALYNMLEVYLSNWGQLQEILYFCQNTYFCCVFCSSAVKCVCTLLAIVVCMDSVLVLKSLTRPLSSSNTGSLMPCWLCLILLRWVSSCWESEEWNKRVLKFRQHGYENWEGARWVVFPCSMVQCGQKRFSLYDVD